MLRRRAVAISASFLVLGLLVAAAPRPAAAIPYFAHEYGFTCQKCHSVVPRLNAFGLEFLNHAYQLPGAVPDRSVSPISTKVNLLYGSDPGPGEPKAVVDEVEAYLAGTIGPRTNYFVEQYLVDGGFPGATRELWVNERLSADASKVPVYLQGGSFTLPLPVDPETFRESYADYAPFVQVVGANPFNFFDPKIGLQARFGDLGRGFSGDLDALQGHDKQSGIPSDGTDLMQYLQDALGPVTLSTYRYEGRRPTGVVDDRFYRQGYGIVVNSGRWESDSLLQSGYDTSFAGTGIGARSSAGFEQLRYQISPRLFVLGRYEGTNDPANGLERDLVGLVGFRVGRNSRLTLEDVLQRFPTIQSTVTSQLTVAY